MTAIHTLSVLAAAAVFAGTGSAQTPHKVTDDWAVPVGMGSPQTRSVLEMLNTKVSGRPFSATAVARMTHTLEDGTHISQITTTVMYRDAEGRTRNETDGVIDIADPLAQVGLRLDTAANSAVRRHLEEPVSSWDELSKTPAASPAAPQAKAGAMKGPRSSNRTTEDLGMQTVNGVAANGVRTRLTIPVGAIGNDRDIVVTQETWTSPDLHVLIKSVSSDPRFGRTTYDLTNIVQAAPASALFQTQVPPGYTVRQAQWGFVGK
jgi:hypothetical protein